MTQHYGKNNEYDVLECCPVCEAINIITNEYYTECHGMHLSECNTKCTKCGHKNHWAYGHFTENYIEELAKKIYSEIASPLVKGLMPVTTLHKQIMTDFKLSYECSEKIILKISALTRLQTNNKIYSAKDIITELSKIIGDTK